MGVGRIEVNFLDLIQVARRGIRAAWTRFVGYRAPTPAGSRSHP